MNEKGFAPIIAIAVLLLFIVGIVIAVVWSLESFSQKTFNKSILSDDAKLKPIIEKVQERKEGIVSEISKARGKNREDGYEERERSNEDGSAGDELEELQERLRRE